MNTPQNPPKPVGFEERVSQYVKLRDIKKRLDDEHKAKLKPINEAMETLEGMMLTMLQTTGQDSAATQAGTVYKTTKRSATIADGDAFRRHVIGTEAWELIDWRANAPAVSDYVEANKDAPPGVNYSTRIEVGVRRK